MRSTWNNEESRFIVVEGVIDSVDVWRDRGSVTRMRCDDGRMFSVAFTTGLEVPPRGAKIRVDASKGEHWLFAKRWSYVKVKPRNPPGFIPTSRDPELLCAALKVVKDLDVFTVDDLHGLEPLVEARGKDLRVLGSLLRSMAERGVIEENRIVRSGREKCHRRPVVEWKRVVVIENIPRLAEEWLAP